MIFAVIILCTFLISYSICSLIVNSNKYGFYVKKILFVPCEKSTSGALLLGGLAILIGSAFVMFVSDTSSGELVSWVVPAMILGAIGYLDDRIELRASIKLGLQFTAALTFCALISYTHGFSISLFVILFVWSLGVFNGSNLLDGIDSFSVKYSTITYLAFAVVGYSLGLEEVVIRSVGFTAPLIAFYFFNKFPSRLHLGEIGSTIMGLNCMYLSVCLYNCIVIKSQVSGININALLVALSLMHLPMTELGVSLIRRAVKRKSPFKGDKKHIHYLLSNVEKKGPSLAASILSLCHLGGLIVNLIFAKGFNPAFAFVASGVFYVSYYTYFGLKYWVEKDEVALSANVTNLEEYRKSKTDLEECGKKAA